MHDLLAEEPGEFADHLRCFRSGAGAWPAYRELARAAGLGYRRGYLAALIFSSLLRIK